MSYTLSATFYADVQSAIKTRLLTATGLPAAADLLLDNRNYEPTPGNAWLRWTFAPQLNRQASLGNSGYLIRHMGAVMLGYFTPDGEGTAQSDAVAASILTVLAPGTIVGANGLVVRILRAVAPAGRNDGAFYHRPFTLGWQADTNSPT